MIAISMCHRIERKGIVAAETVSRYERKNVFIKIRMTLLKVQTQQHSINFSIVFFVLHYYV